MKQIKLTQGQVALVDDTDYDWLNQWKWYAYIDHSGYFYGVRRFSVGKGKQIAIYMHRQILRLKKGDNRMGDHKDHNTLNNCRANLRICTCQQNNMNRKPDRNTSSNFKGVSWNKRAKKWIAQLQINGKKKHLGLFISETEAALTYNIIAKKYFGEFAFQNFCGGIT